MKITRNVNRKNSIGKRGMSLLMAFLILVTTLYTEMTGITVVNAEGTSNHVLLENAYFDITIPLDASCTEIAGQTGVKVQVLPGDKEPIELTMSIGSNSATIKNVPVYIVEGTESRSEGGTGEYKTDTGFYKVKIVDNKLKDDLYVIGFNAEATELMSTVSLTIDDNTLSWTANAGTMYTKKRSSTEYSYTAAFFSEVPTATFPFAASEIKLKYQDSGIEKSAEPTEIKSLGNSQFKVTYKNIPNDDNVSNVQFYIKGRDGFKAYVNNESTTTANDWKSGVTQVKYIKNDSISGSILWLDDSVKDYRKTLEAIKNNIKVYSYTEAGFSDASEVTSGYEVEFAQTDTTSTNTQTFAITGLPQYKTDGTALHYYYKLGSGLVGENNKITIDEHKYYYVRYHNVNALAGTDKCVDEGEIYLILRQDDSDFNITITFQDDSYNNGTADGKEKNWARKAEITSGITLYLWRAVNGDFAHAAPVYTEHGGQYAFRLTNELLSLIDNNGGYSETITKTILKDSLHSELDFSLPLYNENGIKYTYFVTAVDEGSLYSVSYTHDSVHHAESGDTIYLTRVGQNNIVANVDWTKAMGESDYNGSKTTLYLQRRMIGTATWENVKAADDSVLSQVTSQATANKHTLESIFHDVDLYNEVGKTYEFRVVPGKVEKSDYSTTIATDGNINEKFADGEGRTSSTTFTYNNHSYKADISYVDLNTYAASVNMILNTDTKYNFIVSWETYADSTKDEFVKKLLDARLKGEASVTFDGNIYQLEGTPLTYTLNRDNVEYATIKITGPAEEEGKYSYTVTFKDGSPSKTGTLTMSKSGNKYYWTFSSITVPKYNENGYKYTYTGVDSDHSKIKDAIETKYSNSFFAERSYDIDTNTDVVAHRIVFSTGASTYITVSKSWVDDITDSAMRQSTVEVIAYYMHTDGTAYFLKSMETGNLNIVNSFADDFFFDPMDNAALTVFISNQNYADGDPRKNATVSNVYYAPIETAISYDSYTEHINYKDDNGKINPVFLGTSGSYTTKLEYDEANPENVKIYAYEVKNVNFASMQYTGNAQNCSQTIKNAIISIKTDIDVKVTWKDDDNTSGYRKDKYRLKLYRKSTGVRELVNTFDYATPTTINALQGNRYEISATDSGFKDLPLYDANGSAYTYTIEQYVVKGESETLINPKATTATTKTNYVTEISDSEEIVTTGGYKHKQTFTITNSAANENYSTEFYVIWHDEDAYKSNHRSDMRYVLYYTLGDGDEMREYDLTKENQKLETAASDGEMSGSLSSNPYYQKVVFSKLTEFYDHKRVHYYVKEVQIDAQDGLYNYIINYYHKYPTDTAFKTGDYVSGQSIYKHRLFETTVLPDGSVSDGVETEKAYVGENQVIENVIVGTVTQQGFKRWYNMNDMAPKPECTFFLYRESTHDKSKARTVEISLTSTPTAGTYLDSTTIEDSKLEYKFKNGDGTLKEYAKFDQFGAAYTYAVAELMTSDDGAIVRPQVVKAVPGGNTIIINQFDPDQVNQRAFHIAKTWNFNGKEVQGTVSKFYLYRIKCNYKNDDEKYPAAESIDLEKVREAITLESNQTYEAWMAKNAELVETVKITAPATSPATGFSTQSIYAQDGKPYIYFIVEDSAFVSSYTITNNGEDSFSTGVDKNLKLSDNVVMMSNVGVALEKNHVANTKSVAFTNTLRNDSFLTITGTITWDEGVTNIRSEARPCINESNLNTKLNDYIKIKVKRTADTQDGETNPISETVVETVAASNISWDKTSDNVWTYTITYNDDTLLRHAPNGNPYIYFIEEAYNDAVTGENYYISNNNRSAKTTSIVDNKLQIVGSINNVLKGTYTVNKSWTDGYDSYVMRPDKVLVMFQYKDLTTGKWTALTYAAGHANEGKVIVLPVTKAGGWKASFSQFPIKTTDGSSSYTYRAVEIGIGYSDGRWVATTDFSDLSAYSYSTNPKVLTLKDTENVVWDYNDTQYASATTEKVRVSNGTYGSYEVYQGDTDGKTGPTIQTKIKNILSSETTLEITKTWDDQDNIFGVRPDSFVVEIQKRVAQTRNADGTYTLTEETNEAYKWTTVKEWRVKGSACSKSNNDNTWTLTLSNLPLNDDKGNLYAYRAVEKGTVGSYTLTSQAHSGCTNTQGSTTNATALTNSIAAANPVAAVKEWIPSTAEYTSVVKLSASYEGSSTVLTSSQELTSASNSFTWNKIPSYIVEGDEVKNLKAVKVEEIQVKKVSDSSTETVNETKLLTGERAGLSENGNWLAIYEENVGASKTTVTIKNIPTTSAKLTVNYEDDLNNDYDTRFASTTAVLQYREQGSTSTWSTVDGELAKLVEKQTGNSLTAGAVEISATNATGAASYTYEAKHLPLYYNSKMIEYRIVEKTQGELTEAYTSTNNEDMKTISLSANSREDKSSGGYTFAYDYTTNQSDATLTKKLLKTTLKGSKTWVDSNNLYATRATLASNAVTLTVAEAGTALSKQPTISFTEDASNGNLWNYVSTVLPKYRKLTDTLAQYSVTENYGNMQYEVSYGSSGATSAAIASVNQQSGNTESTMVGITNTLKVVKLSAKKVWRNKNNDAPAYDVTFKLEIRNSSGEFEDTQVPTVQRTKSLTKQQMVAGDDTVTWEKLPMVTADGTTIVYRIVETTTNAGYSVNYDKAEAVGADTLFTITNIQTQIFTVKKKWVDTVDGIQQVTGGSYAYSAAGVLEQKVEGSSSWENVAGKTFRFENTYAETKATDYTNKTTVFTQLPMYTVDGKRICYRAIETTVNDRPIESYAGYSVTYVHDETDYRSTEITNTLNYASVILTKTDATTNEPMAGVTFTLSDGTAEHTYSGATDANGKIIFHVMKAGTYQLTETRPNGYQQASSEAVVITEADLSNRTEKAVAVANVRKTGTLTIYKVDNAGNAVDGVTFAVYKKNTTSNLFEKLWNFITGRSYTYHETDYTENVDGTTVISGLEWGEYYVKEVKADGYILDTTEYHFEVNATTVESGLVLQSTTDNRIVNVPNTFTFQKQSLDGTVLTGGTYILYKEADGTTTKIQEFTIQSGATCASLHKLASGFYVIKEKTAPSGFAVNENGVSVYITADGKALKEQGGAQWANNQIVMTDMPIASLKVTKNFVGDTKWENVIRPDKVNLQLYYYTTNPSSLTAYGSPVALAVNTQTDSFTYTFTNLPMYENGSTNKRYYVVKEVAEADSLYTVNEGTVSRTDGGVNYWGAQYEQTIENSIGTPTKKVYITKTADTDTGNTTEFCFKITYGSEDKTHYEYVGEYKVGTYDEAIHDLSGATTQEQVAAGGFIKLTKGQTAMIELPKDAVFDVIEAFPKETGEFHHTVNAETVTAFNDEGNLHEYKVTFLKDMTNNHITVHNERRIYTKIANDTVNHTSDTEDKPTNAGGSVAVITKNGVGHHVDGHDYSEVHYKEGKLGVSWTVLEDWQFNNAFQVVYKESRTGQTQTITVENYLNENGTIKDKSDSCYTALKNRYHNFEIEQSADKQTVYLYLSDDDQGMPYLNEVKVEFDPTITIYNTTENRVGGAVKVNTQEYASDPDGDRVAKQLKVYAKADTENGYCVDLTNIQIENVDDITFQATQVAEDMRQSFFSPVTVYADEIPLLITNDLRFTKNLTYEMAGQTYNYKITGQIAIEETDSNGNPTLISMTIDRLPIPLDIGVRFVKSEAHSASDYPDAGTNATNNENQTDNVKSPKTGDGSNIPGWTLVFISGLGITVIAALSGRKKSRKKSR